MSAPRPPRYNLVVDDDARVRMAEGARSDGPVLEGLLRNVSNTGALLEIRESHARARFLDEGEMIKMELALPERGRFAFFATVVRLEPNDREGIWDLAVQFRNLPRELAKIIDESVTPLSHDYSHPMNYELAARRGSRVAASRASLGWWLGKCRQVLGQLSGSPLFWIALGAVAVGFTAIVLWFMKLEPSQ